MTDQAPPTLRWHEAVTEADLQENAATAARVAELIHQGHRKELLADLDRWAPSSVLECVVQLPAKRAQKLLKWMSDELSLRLLSEIDPRFHAVLFAPGTQAKFAKLLCRLDRDRAARFVLSLPRDYALLLVDAHPDAEHLRAVLDNADSALAAMRRGAVVARQDDTIGDVIETIRVRDTQIEKIDSLHVVDAGGRLTGYLRLRDLILNGPETRIGDIARPNPVKVDRDTDREAVLHLAKKRKTAVIAVVDEDNVLLGVIAPKELAEIARREAEEDMLLMGGVSPESTAHDPVRLIVRRRLPWLMTGLAGAMLTALVVGAYEETLAKAAILASFIPVVSATAGNASMQASTISIQAITSGARLGGDFLQRLGREVAGAAINGTVMAAGLAAVVLVAALFGAVDRAGALMATVALAQVLVIVMAGTLGTLIPFALTAVKVDPAVATGIFILTANDVFGVLILFAIATHLYL